MPCPYVVLAPVINYVEIPPRRTFALMNEEMIDARSRNH